MQVGISFHLIKEVAPLLSVSLNVSLLHPAQILVPLLYAHLLLHSHLTSGNILHDRSRALDNLVFACYNLIKEFAVICEKGTGEGA
jgi:hypothetical protein